MSNRYNSTPNIRYLGKEVKSSWSKYPWLVVKPEEKYIKTFRVTNYNAGESRRIASTLYNDHNLYWVLAAFNNKWYSDPGAMNVFDWPVSGQLIYYPIFSIISPTIS